MEFEKQTSRSGVLQSAAATQLHVDDTNGQRDISQGRTRKKILINDQW